MLSSTARGRWSLLLRRIRDRSARLPELSDLRLFATETLSPSTSSEASEDVVLRLTPRFPTPDPVEPMTVVLPKIRISDATLTGFDNTGNVRIWPGGEALAAWILQRAELVSGRKVLEVGSGLLGLPSLVSAGFATEVTITDGNAESTKNVQKILEMSPRKYTNVKAEQMIWSDEGGRGYDVILAADCVFFSQYHQALLNSFDANLTREGLVFVCSPERRDR